jgi:TRAP-type C4-dicarboxylate transport system permease small subunit
MVVMVFGNVVLRYGFNSGIMVSEEMSRWLFVWSTFLGAVVGLREHAHLGTDLLIGRLGLAGKRVCAVLGLGLMLFATGLLFTGSLAQARINLEVQAPVSGASMAIFYAAGLVFSVSAAFVLLGQLARVLRPGAGEQDLVNVRDSEELAPAERF